MEFNSIHNQREAAENYIKSQKHLGWQLIHTNYDDGGYSGGNLDRPALSQLKEDIALGKIDVVVVYKVDRLSRSLRDFVNLSTFFEKYSVSFVSITQQIDTSNSMGKLTLNMLLSFAQFEREITSERLKDKIKAAKKKGMWTGGFPPIGYSCKNKKLVRNKDAEIIQNIFRDFESGKLVREILDDLKKLSLQTKSKTAFTRNQIYRILSNPLYIGKITHLDKIYKGRHKAIISRQTWEGVQIKLKQQTSNPGKNKNSKYPALLKGLVFCKYCNCAMTPNHTKNKKKIFRYYTCMNIIRYGSKACHLKRINAEELENLITPEIIKILSNPQIAINFLNTKKVDRNSIDLIWQKLSIPQKQIIATELINKIIIDHFEINFHSARELISNPEPKTFIRYHSEIIRSDDESVEKLHQEKLNKPIREKMQKAIQLKEKYKNLSLDNIAKLEKKSKNQIARIFRMNNLVQEIQEKILSPTFPHQLKLKDFEKFPKEEAKQLEWFNDLVNRKKAA